MKEYYEENDDYIGGDIHDEAIEDGDDYEQYIPYYDSDDGEYKYIPAADDFEEAAPKQAPAEVQAADDKTDKILDKIQQLKSELASAGKKSDDDKISKLNGEIKSLKEQLFQIKTAEEMKRQFEDFKKEFLLSQQSQQNRQTMPPVRQQPPENAYRYPEKPYERRVQRTFDKPQKEDYDIEKLVEKVKSEIYQERDLDSQRILKEIEKLNTSNLTELQIIEKINMAVEERISASRDDIVAGIGEKFEAKLNEVKGQTAKLFNELAQRAYENEENSAEKIDKLTEKLQNYKNDTKALLDEYNEKQNDVIVRFSELAEKIQATNVIDKDNLYNETMLDGISDVKSELKNLLKKSEYESEIRSLKDNIESISSELASIKESIPAAVTEATDYQFKLINSNIENIEESLNAVSQANEEALKEISEIKSQALSRIETLEGGTAENLAAIESKITESINAIEGKATESIGAIESRIAENIGSIEGKVAESINAAEEKISGNLSVAENKITDSLTGTEGRIFENISGQSAAISALKEDILSAVSEAMEQHSDRITAEMQNIAGIKDELKLQLNDLSNALADGISAVKAEISQVIEGFNSQFAKLKRQGDDVKDAVDGLTEVFSGMIKDISENMEKKMERITTAADNMSSAVEGMGISIDNLLRQQEDNISAQNDLSGEIAKLSALISTSISSGQENTIDKTRYDELAKSIEKVLAKSGGADKQALAALGAELRELKNTVAGLTSADLSYDLSSIYSELRKMNESGAADIENIKLNQELNTLRNQLNKFDGQEENVETKRKTTKSKPE